MTCACTGCQSRARSHAERGEHHRLEPMLIRIPPELAEELRALARRTRVPLAVYQREAVADLVTKYRNRKES